MFAELSFIATGNELLDGTVRESNSHWLQKKIHGRQARLKSSVIIGDSKAELVREIKKHLGRSNILILSGGLGPTDDDITREACSMALGLDLSFDQKSWDEICKIFTSRGRKAHESNRKQAMKLESSIVLSNPFGTAPAFKIEGPVTTIYAFPGVPSEFQQLALKYLLPKFSVGLEDTVLKLSGIGESGLMQKINDLKLIPDDLQWGTVAGKDGILLRFDASGRTHPEFENTLTNLKTEFDDLIYCESRKSPVDLLIDDLKSKNLTLACAESCTGGMLSSWVTSFPGSSSFFNGAVVAYQNEIKIDTLNVPKNIIEKNGAVSESCALAMAKGALNRFSSDLAVSITGIAGPDGGSKEKPVGTVCIAVVTQNKEKVKTFNFTGNRDDVRERACYQTALMAYLLLREGQ